MKHLITLLTLALSLQPAQAQITQPTLDKIDTHCSFLWTDYNDTIYVLNDSGQIDATPSEQKLCALALSQLPAGDEILRNLSDQGFLWYDSILKSLQQIDQIGGALQKAKNYLGRVNQAYEIEPQDIPQFTY